MIPDMRTRTLGRGIAASVCAALVAVIGGTAAAEPAAAADDVTIVGHGYGHGRGMGQYGAYGYAVDQGWSYDQILSHYYGGTTLSGDAGNPQIGVELVGSTGADAIVTAPGLTIDGSSVGAAAVLVRRTGAGGFVVYSGAGCGGPWVLLGNVATASVTVGTTASPSSLGNLLRVCGSSTTRGYRGSLMAVNVGGTQYLVNRLDSETYLRGVVPRESPASWGNAGSGRGMQALKAQSVAARSYMLSGGSRPSGANTCDSTSCQVYGGAYIWDYGTGAPTGLENSLTDTAIAQTAGQVMRTSSGTIARTEFSSSTGGFTAGGAFAAVSDDGDATSINPYHTWTTSTTLDAVAAALGTGSISSIRVSARNGLGADGGRATQVTVVTTAGATMSFSGTAVRSALGLRSDWFTISAVSQAAARAVVTALYADILGRGVDSAGLATWSAQIVATGNASSTAAALAMSDERLMVFVAQQYRDALHREPEPAGQAYWVALLQQGWTVPDLQAGVYGSDESLISLGGGDVPTWVGAMYQSLLGRSASQPEKQWWAAYASAYGRSAAVAGISHSEEAALVRLNGYYTTMLGRSPDPTGISTFVPVLMTGRGDLTLPIYLGQSEEYWNRALTRY